MSNAKSMLHRVRRLERGRVSPILRIIGSMQELGAHVQAGIDAGTYDRHDMPAVVSAIQRWLTDGL